MDRAHNVLAIRSLSFRYPDLSDHWALKDIHLTLEQGEFLGLLGPSGCGKTTLLRLIAGFEYPSCGSIALCDQEVANHRQSVPPERRDVGMVFQDGALFPHLTAWQNACFGLNAQQSRERVRWLFELLGIEALAKRYPHELSGGQRQRLALLRSLAPAPRLLLLDEPFSNLDVEVRLHLRQELPEVLHQCGVTAVMVTHDPEEALAICSRVAVMRAGELVQIAKPEVLIRQPASGFIARFVLGHNLLPMNQHQGMWMTCLGEVSPPAPIDPHTTDWALMVDPSSLELKCESQGAWRIVSREFLGRSWRYRLEHNGIQLNALTSLQQMAQPGEQCSVVWHQREPATILNIS